MACSFEFHQEWRNMPICYNGLLGKNPKLGAKKSKGGEVFTLFVFIGRNEVIPSIINFAGAIS
jgi:hypothetical protein